MQRPKRKHGRPMRFHGNMEEGPAFRQERGPGNNIRDFGYDVQA